MSGPMAVTGVGSPRHILPTQDSSGDLPQKGVWADSEASKMRALGKAI